MVSPRPAALAAAIIRHPLTIGPDVPALAAIARMSEACTASLEAREHNRPMEVCSGCVVVVEPDQRVIGILTERDVVRLTAQQQPLDRLSVAEVMTQPVISRRQSELTDLFSVVGLLQQQIRHLPIVDEQDRLVGLLTADRLAQLNIQAADLGQQMAACTQMVQVQGERERLISRLASQILASLDVQVILDTTVRQVRQILDCNRVNIWRFEADWATVVVAESTESDLSLVGDRIHDTCLQETQVEVYRQGHVRVVSDIYTTEMSDCHRDLLIRLQTRAKILVPLLCGDELWGLLNVTEMQPRDWQPAEVDFLRSLSMQVAIALQQATQHQQLQSEMCQRQVSAVALQRQRDFNQLIAEITSRFVDSHPGTLDAEIDRTLCLIGEITQVDTSFLFTYDPDHDLSSMTHEWCRSGYPAQQPQAQNIPRTALFPWSSPLLSQRQTIHIPNLAELPAAAAIDQAHWQATGMRALLMVPFVQQQQVVGAIGFASYNQEIHWEEETIRLLEVMGQTIATAQQRLRNEQQIQQSEERLRLTLAAAKQSIYDFNLVTQTGTLSPEYALLLGYDPETFEETYDGWVERVHPQDRARVVAAFNGYLAGTQHKYQEEFRLRHCSGDYVWVMSLGKIVERDEAGCPQRLLGIYTDINDRKQAELDLARLNAELESRVAERTAALSEREDLLQDFLDNANDLIQIVAIDTGRFEFVNRAWRDVLGYTTADVEQLTIFDVLAPDCIPHCQQVMDQMQAGAIINLERVELTFIQKSGQPVLVEGSINCRFGVNADGHPQPLSTRAIFRDITAKKAVEQALQESEIRFRRVFESNVVGMVFANFNGHITNANDCFLAMLGYSRQELESGYGINWAELTPPEYQAQDQAAIAYLQHHDAIKPWEKAYRHKDGHLVPVLIGAAILSHEEGSTVCVVVDISDRKRYETALQESQQFLQTVVDTVPLSIFWKDRNSTYLGANQRFLQDASLGSVSELVGKNDSEMPWGATEAEAYRADDRIVMESGETKLAIIEPQHQQNGTVIWLETNKLPLRNLTGEVVGVLGTYQDITERKNAEIALQRQLAAIEAAVNGIAILEGERYQYLNSAHVKMFGYEQAEELVGQSWRMVYSPEELERFDREIVPVVLAQKSWQGEVTATRKDGTTFPEQLSLTLSTDNLLICVCQDISDRKRYETALQDSQRLLQTVLDTVPLSVFWKDRQSVILGCNQPFASVSGFAEPADMIGRSNFDMGFPQAEAEGYTADDRQVMTSGIAKLGIEETATPANGEQRWIETNKLPLRDGVGNVIGIVGTFQDITDRKQAEQTIRQQAERETVLREITQRIRQSLDLSAILNTAVEQMQQTLQTDRVAVYQFRPDWSGDFIVEAVHEPWVKLVNPDIQKVWEDTYLQETQGGRFQNHETLVIPDIYQAGLQPCHIDLIEQFQAKAFVTTPIFSGEKLWGLLAIYQNATCRQWLDWEVELLQQIASQLAIAIQQASLYEQVQTELLERQQAEAQIARQLRQQTALELILQQIRQSLDLPEILAIATQQVQELLQGDRVIVFQVCHDGHSCIVEEAVAPGLPRLKAMHWEDETWSQEILEHYWQGQPRIVPDVMDDIWTDCLVDYSQAGQIRSKIVAPILQELRSSEAHRWVPPHGNNKLWGVLVVHACHSRRVWRPEEAQLLQQIANQLAIAIQQASLFEQLQQELTERQQAQAQLTLTNNELMRATRLKDEFLANMSHELRTPLNAILGMTEALQEEDVFGTVNAKQLKALKTVERSGSHLLELINEVLDVAKIEAGQMELDLTPTAIAPLCQSSLVFVKQPALKKRIQLTVNLPLDLPAITLDERRIRQVLINLLNNAVKFTPEGGQITLEVIPLAPALPSEGPSYLRFAVTDTGIGIPPLEQQRLFQPFVQVDSALNRHYEGTGLGLALVKRIVDLHGGQVGLTSDVGVGSCFTFDLPYTKAIAPLSAPIPEASPEPPAPAAATATAPLILLAEDNEANISTMVSYLQAKGYRVEIAYNGQEAIDRAQHLTPDLILMDIQMPGMDGLTAIGHIRRDPRLDEVPVIALTSLAMPGDRDRCLAAGATEYMSKPVRLKQLVDLIQTLLIQQTSPP